MVFIKKALLISIFSVLFMQNKTECILSGFWNKLSSITGYKFTKEQTESTESKKIYKHSDAQQPQISEQKDSKSFFNLSASIGNYSIKAPNDLNNIITNLQNRCPDGITIVLVQIAQPHSSDKKITGSVSGLYNDLGTNQALFLTQLIKKLAQKVQQDSAAIVLFIDDQRKKYTIKDKDGNIDYTANFLKAFEDAKIVFYDLYPIKSKLDNNKSLTKNEYSVLLKNIHLADWLSNDTQCAVDTSYLERLNISIMHRGGYQQIAKDVVGPTLIAWAGKLACDFLVFNCKSFNCKSFEKALLDMPIIFIIYSGCIVHILHKHAKSLSHLTNTVTIPFRCEDQTVSIEDMDIIFPQ